MCERKLWSVILVCRLRVASWESTQSLSSIAFLSVKHSAQIVVSALGVRELGLGWLGRLGIGIMSICCLVI